MTKDFEEPIDEVPGDEGSDATASGPDSQEDSLTVDDILGAEQTDDAAIAEASDEDKDLLLDLKRDEWARFCAFVTDWEHERYWQAIP